MPSESFLWGKQCIKGGPSGTEGGHRFVYWNWSRSDGPRDTRRLFQSDRRETKKMCQPINQSPLTCNIRRLYNEINLYIHFYSFVFTWTVIIQWSDNCFNYDFIQMCIEVNSSLVEYVFFSIILRKPCHFSEIYVDCALVNSFLCRYIHGPSILTRSSVGSLLIWVVQCICPIEVVKAAARSFRF